MKQATIIIPARWQSSRFLGKPLTLIGGIPLIVRVWQRCLKAKRAKRIIVATDDMRIAETAFAAGAEVTLTKSNHPSGTDRVAEVAARLRGVSLVVNVQGDEPEIEPALIDRLIECFDASPRLSMATAASRIADATEFADPNIVKVVTDAQGNALYFSRAPIPNDRDKGTHCAAMRHHGIYAYRRKFLLDFVKWKQTPLEKLESLEQLRALENRALIRVILTKPTPPGIDTPEQAISANLRYSTPSP